MAFGKLDFAVSLSPLTAFPLDERSYFDSKEAAEQAAATAKPVGSTETIYYIGQTLCVVEAGHADLYMIQEGPTLEKVSGMEINIDENQFVYKDGKLSLKDFAEAVQGAIPTVSVVDGKNVITWTKPSGDSVEGLNARITALETSVENLNETVGSSQDRTGLYGELDKKANAEDVYDKDATDQAIQEAIKNSNHLRQKIIENVETDIDTAAPDASQYLYLVSNDNNSFDAYLVVNGQKVLIGEKNLFKSVEEKEFTITDESKLTLNKVPTAKVEGLEEYTNQIVQATVGDLEALLASLNRGEEYQPGQTTVVSELKNIYDRLRWEELDE